MFRIYFWLSLCGLFRIVITKERCHCSINRENVVRNYDGSHFRLHLPCEYYLSDVITRTGCHVSVTLDSEPMYGLGNDLEMRGAHFSVSKGKDAIFGSVNADGIRKYNDTKGDNFGAISPSVIVQGNLRISCMEDTLGYINVFIPTCQTMMRYHSDGLVEVSTPPSMIRSSDRYLCGHCNVRKHPLVSLPGHMGSSLKSEQDMTSAWLYHNALRVMGGSKQCNRFQSDIHHCPPAKAMNAMRMCGSLLTEVGQAARCITSRAARSQIFPYFFECVHLYCRHKSSSPLDACVILKNAADHFGCPLSDLNC